MSHIGRRLLPPIFIPNVGHNQSTSRIVNLTFLTKSVSNKSAFFVQRAHSYRAFLRNHIRTNCTPSTTSGLSTQLLLLHQESQLVLWTTEQSFHLQTCSHTYRAVTSSLYLIYRFIPQSSNIRVTVKVHQLVYINSSQNTFQGTSRVRNQQVEDSRSTEDISSQSPIRKESQVVLIRSCHFTCTILYYSELLVATLYSLNHPYYPTRNKESNDSWRRLVIS